MQRGGQAVIIKVRQKKSACRGAWTARLRGSAAASTLEPDVDNANAGNESDFLAEEPILGSSAFSVPADILSKTGGIPYVWRNA